MEIELEQSGNRVGTVMEDQRIKNRRIAIISGAPLTFFLDIFAPSFS